ncbi:MAG TPA: hypothetical protein VK601_29155 [Kofleriaceae bacterium]|nr:hypothetical protein [Kofleriaceae bacterium]
MRRVPCMLVCASGAALVTFAAPPAIGSPADESLWKAEIQAGYGIAGGGSGTAMSQRPTALTITATAAIAFADDPPLAAYGGLVAETLDRNAAGAVAGIELRPHGSRFHLAGGATVLATPYTLWGATVSAGVCLHATRAVGLCGDLQVTAFLGGSDLPEGRTVSQAQLAIGLVVDAP